MSCHYRGAIDRAGFIDAPQTGPAKIASKPTTAPIAIAAIVPVSSEDTCKITNIRIKVRMNSRIKDCSQLPAGRWLLTSLIQEIAFQMVKDAKNAPSIWNTI